MRMNPLIALGIDYADPMRAIATGALARERVDANQTRNALAAAYAQHGAGAMQGDTNALAGIAALDPMAAQGLYTGVQENRRADAGLDLRRQDTQSAISARSAGVANDSRRLQLAEQQAAQNMAQASREAKMQAIATIGQFLPEFEAAPDASAWDRIAQMSGQEDLVGQFGQRDMALAMGRGALRGAQGPDPIKARPGDVFLDPNTMQPMASVPEAPQPGWRQATPEEAARYGAVAGQFGPDGRFDPINPPSGMTIESDGNGGFSMVQGPGAASSKPLNEGQSKNVIYATRASGALPVLEQNADALTSLGDTAAQAIPGGVGRYVQDPKFQQARQAADEFLSAILRKDTGAAITPQEMTIYGTTYLPAPGDSPAVLTQKKDSRARAVEALRRGMTPAEILALEKPNASDPNAVLAPAAPRTFRYNPETDGLDPAD